MITENLSTLKIHKLTQAQYDRELADGNIDETALYLTPDEQVDPETIGAMYARISKESGDATDLLDAYPGHYVVTDTVTGMPEDGYWWDVDVRSDNAHDTTIVAHRIGTEPKMYIKSALNSIWGDWIQIATSDTALMRDGSNMSSYLIANASYLGENITEGAENDTVEFWADKQSGRAWFSTEGMLIDQPSRYGFLINHTYSADVFQIFRSQSGGPTYWRSGNQEGWDGTWAQVYDESNKPTTLERKYIGDFGGRTIGDLRTALDNWMSDCLPNIGVCQFSANESFFQLWDANDATAVIEDGVRWTCYIVGNAHDTNYARLMLNSYYADGVYFLTKQDGAWATSTKAPLLNENGELIIDGNVKGAYTIGEWLQTTADTHRSEAAEKYAVLDGSGWIYHRTPDEVRSDIGAVNKSGDTMTGDLTIRRAGTPLLRLTDTDSDITGRVIHYGTRVELQGYKDESNYIGLMVIPDNDVTAQVKLGGMYDGSWGEYNLYHEGNRPDDLGNNPTGGVANDTVAKWQELGNGSAWISELNQLADQPSQYGFVVNYVSESDVFQIFRDQMNGITYVRSGDNVNDWFRTWRQIDNLTAADVGAVTWDDNILDSGSIKDWIVAQTRPTSIAINPDVADMPYASYWHVDLKVGAGGTWKYAVARLANERDVWEIQYINGTWGEWSQIYHPGNKSQGNYTGNGSGVERRISIGGTGKLLMIKSSEGMTLVWDVGAAFFSIDSTVAYDLNPSFINGIFSTFNMIKGINTNGVSYYYQVI